MAVTCRGLLTIPIGEKVSLILITDLPAYVKGNFNLHRRQEVLRILKTDTLEP